MKRSRPITVDGLLVHPDAPFMERYTIPAQRQPKAPVLPGGKKRFEDKKSALPNRDALFYPISPCGGLAGVAGFEPTNAGVKVPCLTAWRYPKKGYKKMG